MQTIVSNRHFMTFLSGKNFTLEATLDDIGHTRLDRPQDWMVKYTIQLLDQRVESNYWTNNLTVYLQLKTR